MIPTEPTMNPPFPGGLLLGFTGAAGAGKDSCADILRNYGFFRVSFAEALRMEVCEAFDVDMRLLTDRNAKERPTSALRLELCKDPLFRARYNVDGFNAQPRSPRWIMQIWGTEYRRAQDPDYWLKKVSHWVKNMRAMGYHRLCITDVRFENEAKLLEFINGDLIRVVRPNQSGTLLGTTAAHSSESMAVLCTKASLTVHNDGDVHHLHSELFRVITALADQRSRTA